MFFPANQLTTKLLKKTFPAQTAKQEKMVRIFGYNMHASWDFCQYIRQHSTTFEFMISVFINCLIVLLQASDASRLQLDNFEVNIAFKYQ
jgi:hypothetical protein